MNGDNRPNLYHVQDNDRPAFVVAFGYPEALQKWRIMVAKENDEPADDVTDPKGISFVCGNDELIL